MRKLSNRVLGVLERRGDLCIAWRGGAPRVGRESGKRENIPILRGL